MDKYNCSWVLLLATPNAQNWAVTLGQTTYYSVPESEVTDAWRKHEEKHKEQWKREGYITFAIKYLWYQLRYGYQNNPYEIEAKTA